MTTRLRPALEKDIASISALLTDSLPSLLPDPATPAAAAFVASFTEAAVRERLSSPRYTAVVAIRDDVLVGFASLRDGSHLFHLFVHRDHQRQGIGRALWNAILASTPAATITVNASVNAIPTYRHLGFTATAAIDDTTSPPYQPMRWQRHDGPDDG